MNKKEVYKELLNELCIEDDSIREVLKKPFNDGVDVCASDTHWMLRVKPSEVEIEDLRVWPNRININYNVSFPLEVSELTKAFESLELEDEEVLDSPAVSCEECDGEGTVEFEYEALDHRVYYHEGICPICGGTGDKIAAVYRKTGRRIPLVGQLVAMNEVMFDGYNLFVLTDVCKRLEVDTITITALHKSEACAFRINDECEFVLMCACFDPTPKYSIKVGEK